MGQSLLERIVEERVGQTLVGTGSVAVDRVAEEIAREALADRHQKGGRRRLGASSIGILQLDRKSRNLPVA